MPVRSLVLAVIAAGLLLAAGFDSHGWKYRTPVRVLEPGRLCVIPIDRTLYARSAPDLVDLTKEPQHILDMYGAQPGKPSFANNCLLARRLVERGVRTVQLYHEAWDQHGNLVKDITANCKDTDQACAALVKDLKQRGLLDSTLVIWGGEFGRTPMVQGGDDGRDHHPNAFTMWMAGGGMKPGVVLGETDDLGFNVTKDKVHVHDLHATILHSLGFDHTKLTHRFQGRDFRLTDVHGNVVKELLA